MSNHHDPGHAAVDPDQFKAALGRWASGITVVTAQGPDGPVGLTASAFSSLSLHPPLVLVCIGQASYHHDHLTGAPGFGVHILDASQDEVSNTFAFKRGDRFADLQVEEGPLGVPLLGGCLARLACERYEVLEGGDHSILIGRVLAAEVSDGQPLTWWQGGYRRLEAADS
ncbi:MAG: flavin reductase family protein [Thermoleophilia bacterium]